MSELGKLVYEAFRSKRKTLERWEMLTPSKREEWTFVGQEIRRFLTKNKQEIGIISYTSLMKVSGKKFIPWEALPKDYQKAWIHVGEVAKNWVEVIE